MRDYVGMTIAQYRVSCLQGMGGMALVYRAYDLHLDRDVVVKLIRADAIAEEHHERIMNRFEREARAHAGFSHPNIVPVYDYGELDGIPYLVMAYLSGGTLKDRVGEPVHFQSAIHYIKPVADALSYAHKLGVVHRDVKPSNILLSSEDRPALTDFGIADLLEVDETTLTGTGLGVGTPEYMAPEQWMGKSCEASDQYGLGVVLYELITAQKPFQADTPVGLALQQKTDPLIPPSKIVQYIPGCVENVILKMLSFDPNDRYRDMEEASLALGDLEKWIKHNHALPVTQENRNNKEEVLSKTQNLIVNTKQNNKKRKFSNNKKHNEEVSSALTKKKRNWVIGMVFGCLFLLSIILALWKRDANGFQADVQPTLLSSVATPEPSPMPSPMPSLVSSITQIGGTLTPTRTAEPSYTPTITSTHTPEKESIISKLRDVDNMEMVYVPAGEFIYGTGNDGYSVEGVYVPFSEHDVYLDAFWIDKYEVTNQQYNLCVEAGVCTAPYSPSSSTRYDYYENIEYSNYPVISVERSMANTYCNWVGGRLPTDAEWEKAARGTDGRAYPWGNIWTTEALVGIGEDTDEVGSYPLGASPYGAMDMVGNVWEWVSDWYHPAIYATEPVDNPTGPNFGEYRLLRGGSFSGQNYLSTGSGVLQRARSYQGGSALEDVGFRCVMDAKLP